MHNNNVITDSLKTALSTVRVTNKVPILIDFAMRLQ